MITVVLSRAAFDAVHRELAYAWRPVAADASPFALDSGAGRSADLDACRASIARLPTLAARPSGLSCGRPYAPRRTVRA